MYKILRGFTIFLVIFLFSFPSNSSRVSNNTLPAKFHLTVLHTNDFHGEDYSALAKVAALIRKIRNEEKNVLYLDAGDTFTRGKYHEVFYGELEFAILNAIGCQALTLGNNEFKATAFSESAKKYLYERINQAEFPLLCANIKIEENGPYLPNVKPYVVLNISNIKIGIIGITTYQVKYFSPITYKEFFVEDPIETVKTVLPRVAKESDIILALTHIGFSEDCSLAESNSKIQAIIGGHSHTVLQKPAVVNKIPIVQAGEYARYLGRLDLYFKLQDSKYILEKFKGKLIPISNKLPEDREIRELIDKYMKKTEKKAA